MAYEVHCRNCGRRLLMYEKYEKKIDMFPAWAGKPLVALIFVALAFALWTII